MSQATNCCAPCEPVITEVPGPPGEPCTPCADGAAGTNAFTLLTEPSTIPVTVGLSTTYAVANSSWMAIGEKIFIGPSDSVGANQATFQVLSLPSSTAVELEWLEYPDDSGGGSALLAGMVVTPTGPIPVFSPPASLTNSTGVVTPSTTLQPGIGVYVLPVSIQLADLTNNIISVITPGHAFRLLKVDWANNAAGGAAGAATITPTVSNGTMTGGVITLGGTTTVGAVTAGTAVTQTIPNASSSVASITLTASAVTTYTSGDGSILVYIQNIDTLNAVASLNASVNSLIATL